VNVDLNGPQNASTQTDAQGFYEFLGLSAGTWSVVPHKTADVIDAVDIDDVQTGLGAAVGLQSLAAEAALACDVTGNGSVSAYDAALTLQFIDQTLPSFPTAVQCGSDWAFIPRPTPVAGAVTQQPVPAPSSCQPGVITFDPLGQSVAGQNFAGVAFGDCDLDWLPVP
jgi:hypothetical protein